MVDELGWDPQVGLPVPVSLFSSSVDCGEDTRLKRREVEIIRRNGIGSGFGNEHLIQEHLITYIRVHFHQFSEFNS